MCPRCHPSCPCVPGASLPQAPGTQLPKALLKPRSPDAKPSASASTEHPPHASSIRTIHCAASPHTVGVLKKIPQHLSSIHDLPTHPEIQDPLPNPSVTSTQHPDPRPHISKNQDPPLSNPPATSIQHPKGHPKTKTPDPNISATSIGHPKKKYTHPSSSSGLLTITTFILPSPFANMAPILPFSHHLLFPLSTSPFPLCLPLLLCTGKPRDVRTLRGAQADETCRPL